MSYAWGLLSSWSYKLSCFFESILEGVDHRFLRYVSFPSVLDPAAMWRSQLAHALPLSSCFSLDGVCCLQLFVFLFSLPQGIICCARRLVDLCLTCRVFHGLLLAEGRRFYVSPPCHYSASQIAMGLPLLPVCC